MLSSEPDWFVSAFNSTQYTLVVPYTRSSFRSRTRLRGTRRENRYCPATIRSFERDESRPRSIPRLTIAKVRVYFTVSRFHSEEELRKSELRVIRSQVHGERKLVINVPPTPIQSIPLVFFTNRYEFVPTLPEFSKFVFIPEGISPSYLITLAWHNKLVARVHEIVIHLLSCLSFSTR